MNYYKLSNEEVFHKVKSSILGLTSCEADLRLSNDGKNELEHKKGKSLAMKLIEQLLDPMIIILLVAAVISAIVSVVEKQSFADVIIILAVVIINSVLGVYQESKAEAAIEDLQTMTSDMVNVIRDGKAIRVDAKTLVVGDVVELEAGNQVPADGRIFECASLKIEESALTGESVPVEKAVDILNLQERKDVVLAERKNMAYSGSCVVYGRGKMVVTATGMNTELGKIAGALSAAVDNLTPLQIKMAQLSQILTLVVVGISLVVFAAQLFRSSVFTVDVVVSSLMLAVTLAVAAIPEGLAAIVTIILSIGVTRMSKRNAIIRKLTAVETLGCAQIICSDKTGTLTQNKMTVVKSKTDDEVLLASSMVLCCDAENSDENVVGEPTEAAIVNWANSLGLKKEDLEEINPRVAEIPFDSGRKMMSTIHNNWGNYYQFTKGGIDEVLARCTHALWNGQTVELTDLVKNEILSQNRLFAKEALRVLACATKQYSNIPSEITPGRIECGLTFIGFVGMIDPVREEVFDAIKQCETAGIKPIMITGDHVDTACAIARQLDILGKGEKALTGADLERMSDEEFIKIFKNVSVYARVQPEHKTRIVKAWQNHGYVVAMTGDGVNDAPSIKTADIGVGMGITGTDVTKNVADMVLTDDNFATIVNAVEEGRTIYDNILKATQYLLSTNFAEVMIVFFASMSGFTILKPVHLLWINLVTDLFPALSLGFEEPEAGTMKRKPRSAQAGIFSNGIGINLIYQGLTVSVLCLISYFVGMYFETGRLMLVASPTGTTCIFVTISCISIAHSFNMRSLRGSIFTIKSQNWFLWGSAALSLFLTLVVCEVPAIASVFEFKCLDFLTCLVAVLLGLAIVPIVEVVKIFQRLADRKNNSSIQTISNK